MPRQNAFSKQNLTNQVTPGGEATGGSMPHLGLRMQPGGAQDSRGVDSTFAVLDEIKNIGVETLTNVTAYSLQILERLNQIEQRFDQVDNKLAEFGGVVLCSNDAAPTHYTTATFAMQAVKDGLRKTLSPRTVQKWLREKRMPCKKIDPQDKNSEWLIPPEAYIAFKKSGGLTPSKHEG
jgi:hypothetical protein